MITATVQQCVTAHRALVSINTSKIPAKAAWRMARLIAKLRGIAMSFETTQRKIFEDAGGVVEGNQIVIKAPVRSDWIDDAKFNSAKASHDARIKEVADAMKTLNEQVESIDYEPIPIDSLEGAQVSANDLVDAGPFITD